MFAFLYGKGDKKLSTTFRWLVPILLVMVFVFFVSYRGLVQNTATRSTAEVTTLNEIIETGIVRGDFVVRAHREYYAKEELVTNMMKHIATSQKSHGFDVNVYYVFLDGTGAITTDEKQVRGIQFRAEYFKEGKRKATSEKRLALHELVVN